MDSLTDASSVAANALFADDFTKWIFQETGVVKIVATHHHRAGETGPREMYTKKDDLVSYDPPRGLMRTRTYARHSP